MLDFLETELLQKEQDSKEQGSENNKSSTTTKRKGFICTDKLMARIDATSGSSLDKLGMIYYFAKKGDIIINSTDDIPFAHVNDLRHNTTMFTLWSIFIITCISLIGSCSYIKKTNDYHKEQITNVNVSSFYSKISIDVMKIIKEVVALNDKEYEFRGKEQELRDVVKKFFDLIIKEKASLVELKKTFVHLDVQMYIYLTFILVSFILIYPLYLWLRSVKKDWGLHYETKAATIGRLILFTITTNIFIYITLSIFRIFCT